MGDCAAFEEWLLLQRERCDRLALGALHSPGRWCEARSDGEYEQPSPMPGGRWSWSPGGRAHRQLMLLLAASGQRSAALAQYETCRRLLAEELGVEPSAEIRETYELLVRGERPPDLATILAEQERPPRKVGECPYRGLAAFREADAPSSSAARALPSGWWRPCSGGRWGRSSAGLRRGLFGQRQVIGRLCRAAAPPARQGGTG